MKFTGNTLIAIRRLAETPGMAPLLRGKFFADYGVNDLLEFSRPNGTSLSVHNAPLRQERRRGWSSQDLSVATTSTGKRATTAQLRQAFVSGETTPLEVFDALAEAIEAERFGRSTYSPFYCLDLDVAREAARRSAARYARGEPLSALDGIPVPIKDQHAMAGLPISCGTAYRGTELAQGDAFMVKHLRGAGALIYGKTHTTEWGMSPTGISPHLQLPRNVYSEDRGAGGSSTGSGVAVALGLSPVASGSDGGGSIRIPAALNGLFGIKPTWVRIGRTGDYFGASTVSTVGPLGLSTADLVDFLAVTATEADPADPTTAWWPRQRDLGGQWRRALQRGVQGARIGVPTEEWEDLDPALRARGMEALRELERDGAEIVELSLPLLRYAAAVGVVSIGAETMGNLQADAHRFRDCFSDELRLTLALLNTLSADEFLASQRTRALLKEVMRDALEDVDVLAMPTTRTPAPLYPLALDGVPYSDSQATRDMTRFTFLANITGLPAGSVPLGMHGDLPVGLQFVGAAWDEASVLAVMAHAERQGWTAMPEPDGATGLLG